MLDLFLSFNDLQLGLDNLFLETFDEDEISSKLAYYKALSYWKERNRILRSINEMKIELNSDKNISDNKDKISEIADNLESLKLERKQLYSAIDDTPLKASIGKNVIFLTQEEKDLIARYPLKYYISLNRCYDELKRGRPLIMSCIEDLAKRDVIFNEKIEKYLEKYQEYRYSAIFKTSLGGELNGRKTH